MQSAYHGMKFELAPLSQINVSCISSHIPRSEPSQPAPDSLSSPGLTMSSLPPSPLVPTEHVLSDQDSCLVERPDYPQGLLPHTTLDEPEKTSAIDARHVCRHCCSYHDHEDDSTTHSSHSLEPGSLDDHLFMPQLYWKRQGRSESRPLRMFRHPWTTALTCLATLPDSEGKEDPGVALLRLEGDFSRCPVRRVS